MLLCTKMPNVMHIATSQAIDKPNCKVGYFREQQSTCEFYKSLTTTYINLSKDHQVMSPSL